MISRWHRYSAEMERSDNANVSKILLSTWSFNWCSCEISQEPRVLWGAKNFSVTTFFLQAGCAGLFTLFWFLGVVLPFCGTRFPHLQIIKIRQSHKLCKCYYANCIFYKRGKENSNSHFPTSFVIEKCQTTVKLSSAGRKHGRIISNGSKLCNYRDVTFHT